MAKKRKYDIRTRSERIDLMCKYGCGTFVENLPSDVAAVTCWRCVVRMVEPPVQYQRAAAPTEKRSRGWHLKENYVSPSGKVYSFGKEVENHVEIITTDKTTEKPSKKLVGEKKKGSSKKRDNHKSKDTQKRRVRRKKG